MVMEVMESLESSPHDKPAFRDSFKAAAVSCPRVELVCQVQFVEWTDAGHLRHCTFIAIRDDKKPGDVVRETLT